VGRIKYILYKAQPDLSLAPQLADPSGKLVAVARRHSSMQAANRFEFLNVVADIKIAADWNAPQHEKLWLYNLHYFDDLNAVDADKRTDWHCLFVKQWINENPIGSGNGWEPYPSSLRIVNWIKWSLAGQLLEDEWLYSLAIQVRYLSQQLETHLLGNHLFVNAKALVFSGLYFEGKEADEWLEVGFAILKREVPEQILSDGGQFELSPMYHALALEDILDLYNVCTAFSTRIPVKWRGFVASLVPILVSMLKWMQVMNHPDGKLSFFNDAAFNIAPSSNELQDYAERLGIEIPVLALTDNMLHLQNSGYIRVDKQDMLALLDVASIGADYLPGHAHADTLSFELSLFGQRVLVNSGTSCYGLNYERLRQRGTAAHNTVLVNNENSSEVWSGFRVARRARPFAFSVAKMAERLSINCSHTGYQRLQGKPVHRRQWIFQKNKLLLKDTILGRYQEAEARFHFHPDVTIKVEENAQQGVVLLNDNKQLYWEVVMGEANLECSSYHPEFGLSIENQCLVIKFQSVQIEVCFYWNC